MIDMNRIIFLTHPEVAIDPSILVPDWGLSERGIERMHLFADRTRDIAWSRIFCSHERKAVEAAAIVAADRDRAPCVIEALGENDRASTGYLEKTAFEAHADRFFAHPHESIEGWERAIDAQRRIVAAVKRIDREAPFPGHLLILAHGGVGALLLAHLLGAPISRQYDQPGTGGGCFLAIHRHPLRLWKAWQPMEVFRGDGMAHAS